MLKTDLLPSEWLEAFNNALIHHDVEAIGLFLKALPRFETVEQVRECLILTMDAENFLCSLQKNLIERRHSLQKSFSLSNN